MPRRASSGKNSTLLTLFIVIAIALFAVAVTILTKKKPPFSKLGFLPVEVLTENGNSLRDNEYKVEGTVEERWVRNSHEGIHLDVDQNGQTYPIFIKIPKSLERPNLERQNNYAFSVRIGTGGIPIATGVERL